MSFQFERPAPEQRVSNWFNFNFLIAMIGITIAIMSIIAKWTGSNMDKAILDISNVFTGPFSSKSLLVVTGFFCGLVYLSTRYFYLFIYTSEIWDNFFVREGDRRFFVLILVGQLFSTFLLGVFPHYWYLNVAALHLVLFLFLRRRYERFLAEIDTGELTIHRRPLAIFANKRPIQEDEKYAPS
jgi:hypothetical protein